MLVCAVLLALAGDPNPGELPHWREAPEPSAPSKPPKATVPNDGSGMITLGTLLLVSGGVFGTGSAAVALAPELSPTGWPQLGGIAAGAQLGMGTVFLTLGLVIRRQFRSKPTIPGAPRTGGGMLLGGVGLMVGGTVFAAQAIVDIGSALCSGERGCQAIRPIAAPIQLGCSLASVLVGTGLFVVGTRRRVGYLRWDQRRIQSTFSLAPGSLYVGMSARF